MSLLTTSKSYKIVPEKIMDFEHLLNYKKGAMHNECVLHPFISVY